jgi:U2 small nuclear ribonucleoprotein B''
MLQRISYAKSKSNFVAKLDGTFKIPSLNEPAKVDGVQASGDKGTALQQSIFSGAPGSAAKGAGHGLKRVRDDDEDDEDDEESDAPMEEDEEDMEMDESDDD